jgi:hypothetical protein
MTQIKMKATDTLHISSVQAGALMAGDTFEVSEADAKDLERRKLATRVGGAKAEAGASETKMEAAPANKSARTARKAK